MAQCYYYPQPTPPWPWSLVLSCWIPVPIFLYLIYLLHNPAYTRKCRTLASSSSILLSLLAWVYLYAPIYDGCKIRDLMPLWLCFGLLVYLGCLVYDTVCAASHGITFFGLRRRLLDDGLVVGGLRVLGLSLCASAFWCIWLAAYGHFVVSHIHFLGRCMQLMLLTKCSLRRKTSIAEALHQKYSKTSIAKALHQKYSKHYMAA